jgi:hypothetical protein
MSFKAINEFFTAFLENHGDEEILLKWKEESKGLNKIIKKKEKKENKKSSGLSKNKSAYIFFCLEERAEISKKNPELSSKEITKILAKNWGELKENDDDRMTELQEKALKDKERYTKEKSDSENEKSDGEGNAEPKKKKKMSSYILFCKEERATIKAEFPEYNSKEIISELGRRWSELKASNSDKIAYYEKKLKEDEEPFETINIDAFNLMDEEDEPEKEVEKEEVEEPIKTKKKVVEEEEVKTKKNKKKVIEEEEEVEEPIKKKKNKKKVVEEEEVEEPVKKKQNKKKVVEEPLSQYF